ncbi:MAG: hypothetical protein ACE5I1_07750 [bacterium]
MERYKIAIRFISALAIFLPMALLADEGWLTRAQVGGGVLYSKTEHPDIALEKEVLIYKGEGKVEAYFLFRNTAARDVMVDVGFPVKISIPDYSSEHYGPGNILLRSLIYGHRIEDPVDVPFQAFLQRVKNHEESVDLNKRRMMSWAAFLDMNRIWTDNRSRFDLVHNLMIRQDGSPVTIDTVFLETGVIEKDTLCIDFHFLHRLSFQANSYSTVSVKYESFSNVINSGSGYFDNYFYWRYVLGTGRTWKGPIQTIYVVAPDYLLPLLPGKFSAVGDYKKKTLYMARQYEPAETDEISCAYKRPGLGGSRASEIVPFGYLDDSTGFSKIMQSIDEPKAPAQPFVRVKKASSFLPQRTWVNAFLSGPVPRIASKPAVLPPWSMLKFDDLLPAKHRQYVVELIPTACKNIGFGPLSLFDGIPESAWCEGVDGPGIGEWVAFELTEDVQGLAVYNGFQKVRWCWCMTGDGPMREYNAERMKQLKAIYGNNNRVKVLEIVSEDGQVRKTITLRNTSIRQNFEDISLPKGSYKLYIRDIYKGAKWDDTCLGEIEFFRANAKWLVEEDEFLRRVFE